MAADLLEKRQSPVRVAVLVGTLEESGVPAERALAGTGLTRADLENPFKLTSSMQFLTAARNAVRAYHGTDLGLRFGLRLHASCYGMYGYALLCSETMRQMFDTAVRYHRLINSLMDIAWVEDEGTATLILPARAALALPDVDSALSRFLIDAQFAVHVTVIKDVMGSWCVPASATVSGAEPPHAGAMSAALECPIAFDQPSNGLSYPASWLDRAPQLANPITAAQVSRQCARLLEEFRYQPGLTRRVYHELTRTPGRFPEIGAIAASLCMTSRTLRRKLDAEGTSYSDLLTSVRKAFAIDYLSTTLLSIKDIAAALGFSEAAGFRHAFKRWTGKPPNEYRRHRQVHRGHGAAHAI